MNRSLTLGIVVLASCGGAASSAAPSPSAPPIDNLTLASTEKLEAACEGGQIAACHEAGTRHVHRDRPLAAKRFEHGCEKGYMPSCRELAMLLSLGQGVPRDRARADALRLRACDGKDAQACYDLALGFNMNVQHRMVPMEGSPDAELDDATREKRDAEDRAKATKYIKRSCELGYARACKSIKEGVDDELGVQWFLDD